MFAVSSLLQSLATVKMPLSVILHQELILTYQGEEEERKGRDSLGAAIHIDARQLRQVPEVRGIVYVDWKSHDLAIFHATPMYIVNESIEAFIYFSRD